jgi:putative transcriptional regulator
MYINISNILESQNKTAYWLSKEIGCDYHNLLDMCNGKTMSIKFSMLEKICDALDCTPNDLLILEKHKLKKP